MDNQSMREMTKDELIVSLTADQLADIIIMERQHIRDIRHNHLSYSDITALQSELAETKRKLAVAKSIKHRRDIVIWIAEYCWKKANPDSKFSEPPSMLYEQVEKDFFAWLDSTEKAEQEVKK